MNQLVYLGIATLLAASPVVLADHGQIGDGSVDIFAFHPDLFTARVEIDWVGVGGSGGNTGLGTGTPTPDDCGDVDEFGVTYGNTYIALPTVGQKVVDQDDMTLVPGQSVPAPDALVDLCSQARGVLLGQEDTHEYASSPQLAGAGDVNLEASSFILVSGSFDDQFFAQPLTLKAPLCDVDLNTFTGTAPKGDEVFAGTGFDNGILLAQVSSCRDVGPAILQALVDAGADPSEPDAWDAGTINRAFDDTGVGVSIWDLDLFEENIPFGLTAICFQASLVDANSASAGFFEDYGYVWIDGPDNQYQLAPQWAQPLNSDGRAHAQDCNSIGISF